MVKVTTQILEDVPLNTLVPYIQNPRKNNAAVEGVMSSLQDYGYVKPSIVVDEKMVLICGHTTLKAMQRLEWKSVPTVVQVTGMSEKKKRGYRIADNRTGEAAQWDVDLLITEWEAVGDEAYTGFTQPDLDTLIAEAGGEDPTPEQQEAGNEGASGGGAGDNDNTPFVVHYDIIFNTEGEQRVWYDYLKYLKATYPDCETIAERIVADIQARNLQA